MNQFVFWASKSIPTAKKTEIKSFHVTFQYLENFIKASSGQSNTTKNRQKSLDLTLSLPAFPFGAPETISDCINVFRGSKGSIKKNRIKRLNKIGTVKERSQERKNALKKWKQNTDTVTDCLQISLLILNKFKPIE